MALPPKGDSIPPFGMVKDVFDNVPPFVQLWREREIYLRVAFLSDIESTLKTPQPIFEGSTIETLIGVDHKSFIQRFEIRGSLLIVPVTWTHAPIVDTAFFIDQEGDLAVPAALGLTNKAFLFRAVTNETGQSAFHESGVQGT